MSIETFDLGNVQIEAIINGTGVTIVLLAAGGQDASSFNVFTPFLNNAGYKTVAINRRGFAGSKGPLENLTLHDLANDVARVIQKLGENAVHVLGWAFGNRVARCLAEDHPHLVKSVILLAAGGLIPPEPETLKIMAILRNPDSSRDDVYGALKSWLFSPSTNMETVNQAFSGRKTWPIAQQAHNKASQATPLMKWWNGGEAPMLVIQGLDDKSAVPENGHILKREHSERVNLVDIENVGHFMIYEQPKKVAEEIISFLSSF
ncbi:MAG: alpha/beta fold hydrolase [Promethearchaeota archaeon]